MLVLCKKSFSGIEMQMKSIEHWLGYLFCTDIKNSIPKLGKVLDKSEKSVQQLLRDKKGKLLSMLLSGKV